MFSLCRKPRRSTQPSRGSRRIYLLNTRLINQLNDQLLSAIIVFQRSLLNLPETVGITEEDTNFLVMAPRETPLLNLEQINTLVKSSSPSYKYFHTIGIFEQECQLAGGTSWKLRDEFCQTTRDSVAFRLRPPLDQYPQPKPGDIVRIHRSAVHDVFKMPEITHPKNIVYWQAFRYDPIPIHTSRNPTIDDDDTTRRRQLEVLLSNSIQRISQFQYNQQGQQFYTIAGRVRKKLLDRYGHVEILFEDGTGEATLKVFAKFPDNDKETNEHFEAASKLDLGDLFYAQNAKYVPPNKVHLSASHQYGRCIRQVERQSLLGVRLTESLGPEQPEDQFVDVTEVDQNHNQENHDRNNPDNQMLTSQPVSLISTTSSSTSTNLRRSPRFASNIPLAAPGSSNSSSQTSACNTDDNQSRSKPHKRGIVAIPPSSSAAKRIPEQPTTTPSEGITEESMPEYITYEDIRPSGRQFLDIAGHVRGTPKRVSEYNNYAIPLYSGNKHEFIDFFAGQIESPPEKCLTLYVYSKQKETDTDEHIKKAHTLKDGDIILVKNCVVDFKDGKIKLEMRANTAFGKSINVIDKNSKFGKKLMDKFHTPYVEELDYNDYGSSSCDEL